MPTYSREIAPLIQWKPIHDQMIALYIAGYSFDAIAKALGRGRTNVAGVIHDPRAQKAIEFARKRTFSTIMTAVDDQMVVLGAKAIDNIAETINTPIRDSEGKVAVGTKAKVHQDNISFELLGRIGFGRGSQKEDAGGLRLSPETEKKLVAGIKLATKAENDYKQAKDVDFEVVEGSDNGTQAETNTDSS